MKKALVCGAGGFIGGHLANRLKWEGYWAREVDIKNHEFHPCEADEFMRLDFREEASCIQALTVNGGTFDEIYQRAAAATLLMDQLVCNPENSATSGSNHLAGNRNII